MASLRDAVKVYQDELQAGIAWIAFWREGRSWSSDYIYLEMDDTLTPEDRSRLQEIQHTDPAAVVLNGYYCGYLGEDMNLVELTAGVRRHYANGYNNIADFIEAHDNTLSPEQIEEAREAARDAGLPFSEKPYRDGDFDPYVFDGSMSAEDYELMHLMMNEERSERLSEVFSILIDNRSRFEAGELSSAWLTLPTTAEQLHAAMQSVGITADNPQDFFINGYSYPIDKPLALPYDMVCAAGIDELNFLAARLEALAPADLDELNAAAQRRPGFDNIGQIIDYTYNLDFFVHIPEVQTVRDLGDYYLNKSGMVDMPEDWKRGIDLTALDSAGLFYGRQTLCLLATAQGIPCVEIIDNPCFGYRGIHLDVSRHFFPVETIFRLLDEMARYKLNKFHFHLADNGGWRIRIDAYPLLTRLGAFRTESDWLEWWSYGDRHYVPEDTPGAYGGYYTKEEIRRIVAYAAERFIEVIPEIEFPGHSDEVFAAYPELCCSGRAYTSGEFCVGNPLSLKFMDEVLTEVLELFPSKYIHIGGDEADRTAWKSCPRCRHLARELGGVDQVQCYLVEHAEKFLAEHGRTMIGWDEILKNNLRSTSTVISYRG